MGADPSINWNDVRGGYDEAVSSMQSSVDEADANKQYWENQNVLWASMFGNLEENVSNYYDNLTADGATAELNDSTVAHIEDSKQRTLQSLQDRGFTNSGLVAQVINSANTNEAISLANNAYNANKDVWNQKTAYLQGVALPQKQMNMQGLDNASARLSSAYGGLAQAETTRANANFQVEQFNEQHSNDQINAGLGLVGTVAGAWAGGGMGAPRSTTTYNYTAPTNLQYDTVSTK